MTFFTLVSRLRVLGFAAIVLLTGTLLGCASAGSEQGSDAPFPGVQAHPEHLHYLSWGETPIHPLGATGYHSWTPISRPGTMDFRVQMDRLAVSIDSVGSPHVRGFVRALPYDPVNHLHDGKVERRRLSGASASLSLEVPGGFSHLVLHLGPAGQGEGGS